MSMGKILMVLRGSKFLSNSWKQELQVLEEGVSGEVLVIGRRIKMYLAYENIAQVNVLRKIFTADIEVVNKGGKDNLIIKAVDKDEAEKARNLIQKKIADVKSPQVSGSLADEIKKLADLRDEKILTDEEFDAKKKQLLSL